MNVRINGSRGTVRSVTWSKRAGGRAVGLVCAASLVAAACGGGSDDAAGGADAAADGDTVELPVPAEGPVPELPVAPSSIASPLPEIAVRRLNGEGGWSQFRNELPSEQPLLIWFWAPF